MFTNTVELREEIEDLEQEAKNLKETIKNQERTIWKLEQEGTLEAKRHALELDKVKQDTLKSVSEKLITSDLQRVEAVAKLNTYIDMDTKDERKHIQKMLEEAIKSLGQQKVTIQNSK